MGRTLAKENCEHCGKSINKGQSITECKKCNIAIHSKCCKKSNFKVVNDKYYCKNCCDSIVHVYNPFRNLNGNSVVDDNSTDRHYDLEIEEVFHELSDASNVLEHCKYLKTASELNRIFELKDTNATNFSTLFQNIDGNRSNFDSFATHIFKFKQKFSVIGLAETNTMPENKNLFMLDEYQSFYQEIKVAKSKGTGVALYIHNSLSA